MGPAPLLLPRTLPPPAAGTRRGRRGHLLAAGADPNYAPVPSSDTAFLRLAGTTSGDVLRLLIKAGADVHRTNGSGTALHAVCLLGPGDLPEQIALLIGAGADVDARDAAGRTPLAWACARGPASAVRALLSANANPNAQSRAGTAPLHGTRGDLEITALLLDAGADPNLADAQGETPLHAAVSHGTDRAPAVVELLVRCGARLEARTLKGYTPLHVAAVRRDATLAHLLVERGADPHATDADGVSPLQFAVHVADEALVAAIGGAAGRAALLQREQADAARIAVLEEQILSALETAEPRFSLVTGGFKYEYDNTDVVWCASGVWKHRFTDGYTGHVREEELTRSGALEQMRALVARREDSPLQVLERIQPHLHAMKRAPNGG